jgi:uncharacterized protein (TIGR03790 family)
MPSDLGIVVNTEDPQSVAIGNYYQARRQIPKSHLLQVQFRPGSAVMDRADFERVAASLRQQISPDVQALVLTWMKPWRVDCMSITTAFAAGFDPAFCAEGCKLTRPLQYFNSNSQRPFDDFGLRPTMSLAARDLASARRLIDRGLTADHSVTIGTAYLVETSDRQRSVRAATFPAVQKAFGRLLPIELVHAEYITNRQDVMFYFTGLTDVPLIRRNRFLPGAVADHLTSTGGVLEGGNQMSSLEWLEAGATGSYGAVVEPCNFPGKFPNPGVLLAHYLRGETLVEAYWKSVAMPGQGIFIGEPLAAPYSVRHFTGVDHADANRD